MTTLKLIGILLSNLPEIMRIIRLLEKRQQEKATDAKIKEDFKTIGDAFDKNDADALNRLFNS